MIKTGHLNQFECPVCYNNMGIGKERPAAFMGKQYFFDAVIREIPENGGAYVVFPWDIRKEFGKGRVKVHTAFDGVSYDGSIVNMGVKDSDGEIKPEDLADIIYKVSQAIKELEQAEKLNAQREAEIKAAVQKEKIDENKLKTDYDRA